MHACMYALESKCFNISVVDFIVQVGLCAFQLLGESIF